MAGGRPSRTRKAMEMSRGRLITAVAQPKRLRLVETGRRLKRLDVRPLVAEVLALVGNRRADPRLKWFNDGRVKVLVGKIIPQGRSAKLTLQGRRKRFGRVLAEEMLKIEWEKETRGTHHFFRRIRREVRP